MSEDSSSGERSIGDGQAMIGDNGSPGWIPVGTVIIATYIGFHCTQQGGIRCVSEMIDFLHRVATGGRCQNSLTFPRYFNDLTEIFKSRKSKLFNIGHDFPLAMSQIGEIHA